MNKESSKAWRPPTVGRTPEATRNHLNFSRGDTHDGMKSAEQMGADFRAWCDAQPVKTRCLFCDWTHWGTAEGGRALSLAHRRDKHPDAVKQPRRRGRKPSLQGDPGSGAERLRGMSFVKDSDGVVEAELVAEQRREIARKLG